MKISKIIQILQAAQDKFGDVDGCIVNPETGNQESIQWLYKTHPETQESPFDRTAPVNGVCFTTDDAYDDLVLE